MTTNTPQPRSDNLESKLDDIKTALGVRTTTTSSVLEDIKTRLGKVEREAKKGTLTAVAGVAASYVLIGLVLNLTADALSKAYWFGWGLFGIGIVGAVYCWYKSSRIRV